MRHKHAEILIAIGNGEAVEYKSNAHDKFEPWPQPHHFESGFSPLKCDDLVQWRIKQRTIKIGDIEVPEPFRGELSESQKYFMATLKDGKASAGSFTNWTNTTGDDHVASGLVHLTKAAALAHAEALIALTKEKQA